MTDVSMNVPEGVVVAAFSGMMAVSPEIYLGILEDLAEQHGIPCDDAFKMHVEGILAKQPPIDPDLF